jgi:hypothetical protein
MFISIIALTTLLGSNFFSPPTAAPANMPVPAEVPLQLGPDISHIADLIGTVESDSVGGYNAANAGRAMDLGRDGLITLTGRSCDQITIGEIIAWQNRGLLYAVGRYQMVPRTLIAAVKWAGLKHTDKFSPTNQNRLLVALLKYKRPSVWRYLTTKGASLNAAVMALAREWAGLPTLGGRSYYGWGNRSHTNVAAVTSALTAARIW